jgi:hypothetical protein
VFRRFSFQLFLAPLSFDYAKYSGVAGCHLFLPYSAPKVRRSKARGERSELRDGPITIRTPLAGDGKRGGMVGPPCVPSPLVRGLLEDYSYNPELRCAFARGFIPSALRALLSSDFQPTPRLRLRWPTSESCHAVALALADSLVRLSQCRRTSSLPQARQALMRAM